MSQQAFENSKTPYYVPKGPIDCFCAAAAIDLTKRR